MPVTAGDVVEPASKGDKSSSQLSGTDDSSYTLGQEDTSRSTRRNSEARKGGSFHQSAGDSPATTGGASSQGSSPMARSLGRRISRRAAALPEGKTAVPNIGTASKLCCEARNLEFLHHEDADEVARRLDPRKDYGVDTILNPLRAMYCEHCCSHDAQKRFTCAYGFETTPLAEWDFVCGADGVNTVSWALRHDIAALQADRELPSPLVRGRNAAHIADLLTRPERVRGGLGEVEVIALRLMTGPMHQAWPGTRGPGAGHVRLGGARGCAQRAGGRCTGLSGGGALRAYQLRELLRDPPRSRVRHSQAQVATKRTPRTRPA